MKLPVHSGLTKEEQKVLDEFVNLLRQQFGARILSVILFGSRARGDAHSESDVDLAVIMDRDDPELREAIRFLAADVFLDNHLFISTRVWSQKHWNYIKTLQTGLYQNVQKDGIELLPSEGSRRAAMTS